MKRLIEAFIKGLCDPKSDRLIALHCPWIMWSY